MSVYKYVRTYISDNNPLESLLTIANLILENEL